jgi:hypothetical protein
MASQVVFWRGECWYLYDGYYKNRRGELLHREIYIDAHGPIGDDVEVYHRDEDKSNWALDNLEALSIPAHRRLHPRGFVVWDTERRRKVSADGWSKREPRSRVCGNCGATFQSIGQRAKFCSPNCKAIDFRKRHPGYADQYSRGPGQPAKRPRPGLQS